MTECSERLIASSASSTSDSRSTFSRFFGSLRDHKVADRSRFDHMLDFAHDVASKNPAALVDVMRLFLRPLQAELLMSAPIREHYVPRRPAEATRFFSPHGPHMFRDLQAHPKLSSESFRVSLARDSVLPCPWRRDDYVKAISRMGSGKSVGAWQAAPKHRIVLWLPWGIPFVIGGNHSIAAGVIAGEGVLTPTEVWDLSAWLESVQTDGRTYFHRSDKRYICAVVDLVRAAIFEVGRLMTTHGVVPMLAS